MSRPPTVSREYKRREAAQAAAVRKRDVNKMGRPCCQFEVKTSTGWRQCGNVTPPIFTCHILRRNQCGKLWDHPDVAINGCDSCHKAYDNNTLGEATKVVRVPYARAKVAWDLALAGTKSRPFARYNPDENPLYEERAA